MYYTDADVPEDVAVRTFDSTCVEPGIPPHHVYPGIAVGDPATHRLHDGKDECVTTAEDSGCAETTTVPSCPWHGRSQC